MAKKSSNKSKPEKSSSTKSVKKNNSSGLLKWIELNYLNVLLLVGYILNFILVLIHNTLLASVYLILGLIKLLSIINIKKSRITIKSLSSNFSLKRYEDVVLIIYPLIPALYYTDKLQVTIITLYWVSLIIIKEYSAIVKLFRKLIKKR